MAWEIPLGYLPEWFSQGKLPAVILILLVTYIFAKILRTMLGRALLDPRVKIDSTQLAFMRNGISLVVYLIGIGVAIYIVPSLRSLSVSLFAGAGVLAVVIGFASQQALSNIIAGIFIAIFKPFRVDDRITLAGKNMGGRVEDITLRHTVIRTYENKRIIVPNSVMSTEIIENASIGDEKICQFVEIGISYDADVKKAIEIMREESMKHRHFLDNRTKEEIKKGEPLVAVRVIGYGDSSVNLRAWVWADAPGHAFTMRCDLLQSIKERFDKEGIEIPFPYRTVVYKKDEEAKQKRSQGRKARKK